jgi:hypothetical protein
MLAITTSIADRSRAEWGEALRSLPQLTTRCDRMLCSSVNIWSGPLPVPSDVCKRVGLKGQIRPRLFGSATAWPHTMASTGSWHLGRRELTLRSRPVAKIMEI